MSLLHQNVDRVGAAALGQPPEFLQVAALRSGFRELPQVGRTAVRVPRIVIHVCTQLQGADLGKGVLRDVAVAEADAGYGYGWRDGVHPWPPRMRAR